MTARTHDLAAASALGVMIALFPPASLTLSTALIALLANQLGGITPDIDQPTAPLWRNLPTGNIFGKFVGKLLGGHRFISHSILGVVLFGFVSKIILQFLHPSMPHVDIHLVWQAYMIGIISHLVMDTLTKEGVPWLLPIPFKFGIPPIKKLRLTTGKLGESLIFIGLLTTDVVLCVMHSEAIKQFLHRLG